MSGVFSAVLQRLDRGIQYAAASLLAALSLEYRADSIVRRNTLNIARA